MFSMSFSDHSRALGESPTPYRPRLPSAFHSLRECMLGWQHTVHVLTNLGLLSYLDCISLVLAR